MKLDNHLSFRMQGIYIVNLPSFGQFLLNFILSMATEKIRKRFLVMENCEDVKQFIDPKILPREYGGDLSFKESIDDLWKLYEKHREEFAKFVEFDFDCSKIPQSWWLEGSGKEQVGSFRQLEID
jgi:hypothetical protein